MSTEKFALLRNRSDACAEGMGMLRLMDTALCIRMKLLTLLIGAHSNWLTKKAEPPPTRGVNRDSGTASANGGWLRRLVRPRPSPAKEKKENRE